MRARHRLGRLVWAVQLTAQPSTWEDRRVLWPTGHDKARGSACASAHRHLRTAGHPGPAPPQAHIRAALRSRRLPLLCPCRPGSRKRPAWPCAPSWPARAPASGAARVWQPAAPCALDATMRTSTLFPCASCIASRTESASFCRTTHPVGFPTCWRHSGAACCSSPTSGPICMASSRMSQVTGCWLPETTTRTSSFSEYPSNSALHVVAAATGPSLPGHRAQARTQAAQGHTVQAPPAPERPLS